MAQSSTEAESKKVEEQTPSKVNAQPAATAAPAAAAQTKAPPAVATPAQGTAIPTPAGTQQTGASPAGKSAVPVDYSFSESVAATAGVASAAGGPGGATKSDVDKDFSKRKAPGGGSGSVGGGVGGGARGTGQRRDRRGEPSVHKRKTAPPPDARVVPNRLFLGNLASQSTDEHALRAVFGKYGEITDVVVKRSYGFIQFKDPASATAALKNEQGRDINGARVDIQPCDDRAVAGPDPKQARRGPGARGGPRGAGPGGAPGAPHGGGPGWRDQGWGGGAGAPPSFGAPGAQSAGYAGAHAAVAPQPQRYPVPVFCTDDTSQNPAITVANVLSMQTALLPTVYQCAVEGLGPELDKFWESGSPFAFVITKDDAAKGVLTLYSFDPAVGEGQFHNVTMADVLNRLLGPQTNGAPSVYAVPPPVHAGYGAPPPAGPGGYPPPQQHHQRRRR